MSVGCDGVIKGTMGEALEEIRHGPLATMGLLSEGDAQEATEVLKRAASEGLETIRILFADAHGILRGKTIVADLLGTVFASGLRVPSTLLLKDTSHRTVYPIWSADEETPMRGASDVLLVPRPETFRILPYSAHSAIIHCNVAHLSGEPVPFASREILSIATDRLATQNLTALMGLEVEFQVFEIVGEAHEHPDMTIPPRPPAARALNQGYQYLTETRYGEAEELLDCLRRTAQSMDMQVQSVEIEMGPGQFEFTFAPADPMAIADMSTNFRTMVKEVCQRRGLLASFMAKPKLPNAAANGWHIHQSIWAKDTGENMFAPGNDGNLTATASAWIAGLLENAAASCLMTTPTVNGYKRYAPYQLAPNRIGWGNDNRGAMIRVLTDPNASASRIENRVADSTANPYFALASQIYSGLDGLDRKLEAPPPLSSPYENDAKKLPTNLHSAIEHFEDSKLFSNRFGPEFTSYTTRLKRAEWQRYLMTVSEWEHAEYFTAF